MGNFVDRTTLKYLRSVNDPDYPDPPYLFVPPGSPNETLLLSVPNKYLVKPMVGDTVQELDAAGKAAADQAIRDTVRQALADRFDDLEDEFRAFALALLDEFNSHAVRLDELRDAVANASNLAAAQSAMAALPDFPQRTVAQMKTAFRNKLGT